MQNSSPHKYTKSLTRYFSADKLAIIAVFGRNFDIKISPNDVDRVIKPPTPLGARPFEA